MLLSRHCSAAQRSVAFFNVSFWKSSTFRACYSSRALGNVITDMTDRGLVANVTSPDIKRLTENSTTIYCGVDPTANSLHLGNMVTLMGLLHFGIRGHQPIALVGGATGSIGDPSGRKSERVPLSPEVLEQNVAGIERQIHRFFKNGAAYAQRYGFTDAIKTPKVLNNYSWFSNMTALDFLSNIGRYARVNTMLAKESVKSRMDGSQGISFTEFSYQLLQAYDFWYLYQHHGCRIQLGGSDQWGNITAGIDLIGRQRQAREQEDDALENKAFGITIPLLLTSTGEKFGKSAGNAVWLDETKTSYFDFYQFFMKAADADVAKYLSMFTFMDRTEIDQVMQEHNTNPEKRYAQQVLANETTELFHGIDGLKKAQTATKVLFGENIDQVSGSEIVDAFKHDHSRLVTLNRGDIIGAGLDGIAAKANATRSKSETQKMIKAGGLYLNNVRVTDPRYKLQASDLIDNQVCILRVGKSSYHLVHAA